MKDIKTYLQECGSGDVPAGNFATPMNTTGMGNPMGPDENGFASEPLVCINKQKQKKKRKKLYKLTKRGL